MWQHTGNLTFQKDSVDQKKNLAVTVTTVLNRLHIRFRFDSVTVLKWPTKSTLHSKSQSKAALSEIAGKDESRGRAELSVNNISKPCDSQQQK